MASCVLFFLFLTFTQIIWHPRTFKVILHQRFELRHAPISFEHHALIFSWSFPPFTSSFLSFLVKSTIKFIFAWATCWLGNSLHSKALFFLCSRCFMIFFLVKFTVWFEGLCCRLFTLYNLLCCAMFDFSSNGWNGSKKRLWLKSYDVVVRNMKIKKYRGSIYFFPISHLPYTLIHIPLSLRCLRSQGLFLIPWQIHSCFFALKISSCWPVLKQVPTTMQSIRKVLSKWYDLILA